MRRGPMEVIDLKGSYREIGNQYGEACSDGIKENIALWIEMIQAYYPKITKNRMISLAQQYLEPYQTDAPELVEELEGMSEATGVSFEEMLFLQVKSELLFNFADKLAEVESCTSFSATGDATSDGKTIAGQNWDWFPRSNPLLMRVRPEKGKKFLALTLPGMLGICGINEVGIAHQANAIVTSKSRIGVAPYGGIHQKVLTQKNIGDMIGIVYKIHNASGDNYLMASSEGDIVDVELTVDGIEVLYPDQDYLVHANHLLAERFKSMDRAGLVMPGSYVRMQRLRKLIKKNYGQLTVDLVKDLFRDHSGCPDSLCRHIDEEDPPHLHRVTRASMISVPGEQKIYVANGEPCENEYYEYEL